MMLTDIFVIFLIKAYALCTHLNCSTCRGISSEYPLLRARRNEKEMKVKPATSFTLSTIFIHKKIR